MKTDPSFKRKSVCDDVDATIGRYPEEAEIILQLYSVNVTANEYLIGVEQLFQRGTTLKHVCLAFRRELLLKF